MAYYVPKYKGYVADVADIDFKRCDGLVYSCKEATATSFTPGGDAITITGGQGLSPLAYIDSARTLEASFTNAAFDVDMFEALNDVVAEDGDLSSFETGKYEVLTGSVIELPFEVDTTSVYIRGLQLTTSTPTTGKFSAAYDDTNKKTTVTLYAGDIAIGSEVMVSYNRRIAGAHAVPVKSTSTGARGTVWFHIPVYSSGTDCTVASQKGIIHVEIFRVRVTTPTNIDTSYKTAATFPVTFSAIDPQRPDGLWYTITYEELTSSGAISTDYNGTAVYR